MGEGFGGSHFEKLIDRLFEVTGGEHVGLEAAAFAGWAGYKDVGEELHRDFFVAHTPATFATTTARVEGEGGGGQTCALGFFGGGVEFADGIVNVEVKKGRGARGLGERRLIHEDDIGDGLGSGERSKAREIFDRFAHSVKKRLVDDFVNQGALA